MEPPVPEESRGNSLIYIEEHLIFEPAAVAALVARRKRMEIRRFKQMAASGNVSLSVHKRSRPGAASCEQCEEELKDSPLCESLSEADLPNIPVTSQSFGNMEEFWGRPTTGSNTKYGVLFRSASFPPEGWDKSVNKCAVKISKNTRTSTASGRDSKCVSTAHAAPCVSPGACTDRDADAGSSPPSPIQIAGDEKKEAEMKRDVEKEKHDVAGDNKEMPDEGVSFSRFSFPGISLDSKSSLSDVMSKKSHLTDERCPPHGKLSVLGRRREMEDAVAIVPHFVSLLCGAIGGCCDRLPEFQSIPALHFFGVYDGHGGSQASTFCKERLHIVLAEEVIRVTSLLEDGNFSNNNDRKSQWERAMTACFLKLDREVGGVCPNGYCSDLSSSSTCCADTIAPATVGSTAVVAVVNQSQIIIGNCGDSRAVISRAGKAIALSIDQKPEREDERSRIEAAGGRVVNWDGYRVGGFLAMSRAIGDRYLKPYVIAEPEVTCMERTEEDDCLILATDGLWDVVGNDLACEVARKVLTTARRKLNSGYACPTDEDTPTTTVAALLTKLALAKGSTDNITVLVIDLKARHR